MWKFIKRTFQIIAACIVVGIVALVGHSNSERLATDMVFLSCNIIDANSIEGNDNRILQSVKKTHGVNILGRLKKDWIRSEVLLNWIDDDAQSEDGLLKTVRLKIEVDKYTGYNWSGKVRRTFNRETLLYRIEYEKSGYWVERQCSITPKNIFEKLRKKMANETKAKQNI